jgi:hypothetical protein
LESVCNESLLEWPKSYSSEDWNGSISDTTISVNMDDGESPNK